MGASISRRLPGSLVLPNTLPPSFFLYRPVGGRAGQLLAEHLFATSRLQLGELAGEVLRLGRDAGVTVDHSAVGRPSSGVYTGRGSGRGSFAAGGSGFL